MEQQCLQALALLQVQVFSLFRLLPAFDGQIWHKRQRQANARQANTNLHCAIFTGVTPLALLVNLCGQHQERTLCR